KHILGNLERPRLDKQTEARLLTMIATDLRDMNHQVEQHDGFLTVTSMGDRRIVLSHALLPKVPGTVEAEIAYATGRNNAAPIDHLRVKRALPSAIELCAKATGARPAVDA